MAKCRRFGGQVSAGYRSVIADISVIVISGDIPKTRYRRYGHFQSMSPIKADIDRGFSTQTGPGTELRDPEHSAVKTTPPALLRCGKLSHEHFIVMGGNRMHIAAYFSWMCISKFAHTHIPQSCTPVFARLLGRELPST